uniref:Uncharacterized protein n=1 Tax=Arundo donax TaxID=35708 RepID=A0A0A9BKE0_ARUDO
MHPDSYFMKPQHIILLYG